MRLTSVAAGSAVALAVATLVALPVRASAEQPVVTTTDDAITFTDPALANEDTTTVEGTLRVIAVDGRGGGEYRYSVETDSGRTVPVEVGDDLPVAAANGDIEAEVVDAGTAGARLAEATVEPTAAAAAPAASAHRAYVVRVTGMGGTLPTAAAAESRLEQEVLGEWAVESDGAIPSFAVDGGVQDMTLASTGQSKAAVCAANNPDSLWNRGAAKFPTVRFEPTSKDPSPTQNHLVVLISGCSDQAPLGIGTVGSSIADGGASTLVWDTSVVDGTGVHELGHNFGLGHANIRPCETCAALEYADIYSVMGFGVSGSAPQALDSAFRDRLGITEPGEVVTLQLADGDLQSTTDVRLDPRGLGDGPRAVRVEDPASGRTLWLELRFDVSRDAGSRYSDITVSGYTFAAGVTVTELGDDGELDLVPQQPRTAGTDVGSTFRYESGGLLFDVENGPGYDANLRVTLQRGVPKIATGGVDGRARVGAEALGVVSADWPAGTTFTYEWKVDGTTVSRAATYTPAASRRGQQVSVRIDATPPGNTTQQRTSAPVMIGYGTITGPTPRTTGSAKVGSTLAAVADTVRTTPAATYAYRWYRGTSPISGAVNRSYTLTRADRGAKVRLRVVATKTGYAQRIRYSAYVGPTT